MVVHSKWASVPNRQWICLGSPYIVILKEVDCNAPGEIYPVWPYVSNSWRAVVPIMVNLVLFHHTYDVILDKADYNALDQLGLVSSWVESSWQRDCNAPSEFFLQISPRFSNLWRRGCNPPGEFILVSPRFLNSWRAIATIIVSLFQFHCVLRTLDPSVTTLVVNFVLLSPCAVNARRSHRKALGMSIKWKPPPPWKRPLYSDLRFLLSQILQHKQFDLSNLIPR